MSEAEALLRGVIDNPDDDAPRLVYADWLEEHGQPDRAEFIRLQCEYERTSPADLRRQLCEFRARDLLELHRERWCEELPRHAGVGWLQFRRGFPYAVVFQNRKVFEKAADAVFAAAPVRSAHVGDLRGTDVEAISDSAHAGRLLELTFLPSLVGAHGAFVLATAPKLRGLRLLNLTGNNIRDGGAERLAVSGTLRRLEALILPWNNIGPQGAQALAAAPFYDSALALNVRNNPIDADSLSRLRVRFPRLRTGGVAL